MASFGFVECIQLGDVFGAAQSASTLFCLRPLLAHTHSQAYRPSSHKTDPQGGIGDHCYNDRYRHCGNFFPEQFDKPFRLTVIFAAAIGLASLGPLTTCGR